MTCDRCKKKTAIWERVYMTSTLVKTDEENDAILHIFQGDLLPRYISLCPDCFRDFVDFTSGKDIEDNKALPSVKTYNEMMAEYKRQEGE